MKGGADWAANEDDEEEDDSSDAERRRLEVLELEAPLPLLLPAGRDALDLRVPFVAEGAKVTPGPVLPLLLLLPAGLTFAAAAAAAAAAGATPDTLLPSWHTAGLIA
jgi:hypothetical protein